MNKIKLSFIENPNSGVLEIVETEEAHFTLGLFFSDMANTNVLNAVLADLERNNGIYQMSFDTSRIEKYRERVVISDQEDEYLWLFKLKNLMKYLMDWKIKVANNIKTVDIVVVADLMSKSDYDKLLAQARHKA